MGIKGTKLKGRIKLKGRPENQAKAEIMVMREKEKAESRKRRRMLFNLLDLIIIVAFGLAIYFGYLGNISQSILFLVIAGVPLVYFLIRRTLRNKTKNLNIQKRTMDKKDKKSSKKRKKR